MLLSINSANPSRQSRKLVVTDEIYEYLKCQDIYRAVGEFDGSKNMLRMLVILRYVTKKNGVFIPVIQLDEHAMTKWREKIEGMRAGSPSSNDEYMQYIRQWVDTAEAM